MVDERRGGHRTGPVRANADSSAGAFRPSLGLEGAVA